MVIHTHTFIKLTIQTAHTHTLICTHTHTHAFTHTHTHTHTHTDYGSQDGVNIDPNQLRSYLIEMNSYTVTKKQSSTDICFQRKD